MSPPPSGASDVLVVPRVPGPLRRLDDPSAADRDELDEMIDEVLGPSTDEGPGIFDAVLVVVGLALVAWSALGGGGPWFAIGIVSLILGVALPARSLVRAATARRADGRRRRVLRTGLALDASDPGVAALATAYDALREAAALPDVTVSVSSRALEAGHAAVLEVASLLGGRSPVTTEERAYVARRVEAIRGLAAGLTEADRASGRSAQPAARDDGVDPERANAVVRAREELEADAGAGSLDEMDRLRAELRDRTGASALIRDGRG